MASNVIRAVGDFQLATATIITSAGIEINIKPNIVQLTLFEDCQRNSLSGEIMVQDSAGFVNEAPIIGQEYLQFHTQEYYLILFLY